eukprot:GEMP01006357.1.p1 GENE.GEMP01006357.1~~GEMP01006357.1.p1  ORF type:complete len:915 (+),score=116.98 GEMP01006357.1:201-2945(+)
MISRRKVRVSHKNVRDAKNTRDTPRKRDADIPLDKQYESLDDAITRKDAKKVKIILKEDSFDISILSRVDRVKETPMQKAARAGLTEIVTLLISAKIDVSGSQQNEAFILAASWGQVGILGIMLQHKADLNTPHPMSHMSPLMLASLNGLTDCVSFLLSAKAEVNNESRLGKTALSIAWAMHDLKTVRLLVQSGAALSPSLWIEALASANLCHTLASGFGEWKNVQRQSMKNDQSQADPSGGMVKVPPEAVLQWIVHAPLAASVLMSDVLIQRCHEAPPRADIGNQCMTVVYSHSMVFDKTLPEFSVLCPPDSGLATTVAVDFLEVEDPLRCAMLYAISKSRCPQLYSSLGIHGTISVGWTKVRACYMRDVVIEFALLVTMFLWVIFLKARNDVTFFLRWSSLILLVIITLREFVCFIGHIHYQSETGDVLLSTARGNMAKYKRQWLRRAWRHVGLFDLVNLSSSFVLLFNAGVVTYEEERTLLIPEYLIFLSITASIRWLRLLQFVCSFRQIGPAVLPIMKSISAITSFMFVFFTTLVSFVHATYWFNYNQSKQFPDIGSFLIRQFFLGMVARWPVFMELMCDSHHVKYHLDRWDQQGKSSEYINLRFDNDPQNRLCQDASSSYWWQLIWYLGMAFTVSIVLLQVFVGVLSAAYRDQMRQSYDSFLQWVANTLAFYFINRTTATETERQRGRRVLRRRTHSLKTRLAMRVTSILRNVFGLLRECTGMIKAPATGQYVWICTPVDQLNVAGKNQEDEQWSKLLESNVNILRDACKNEKDAFTRLSDAFGDAENRVEHLYQESNYMDSAEFLDQLRFNRKMVEMASKRQATLPADHADDCAYALQRIPVSAGDGVVRRRGSVQEALAAAIAAPTGVAHQMSSNGSGGNAGSVTPGSASSEKSCTSESDGGDSGSS